MNIPYPNIPYMAHEIIMRYIILLLILCGCVVNSNSAYIATHKGWVDFKNPSSEDWIRLNRNAKIIISEGCKIRTGRASTAEIYMDDGSRVVIAPQSLFELSKEDKEKSFIGLYFGKMRSWVKKLGRQYQVKTPTAVCAVRGTDFAIASDKKGTRVEVYGGSVMAWDNKGGSALIGKGEFIHISKDGQMGSPKSNPNPPTSLETSISDPKTLALKEIYNELSKQDIIKRAQMEMQTAEYQNNKVAIDAFGYRVRMEEYVVRPADNQFKYVVLNTRDNRFDFGKLLFTFNQALPKDLSIATENMIYAEGQTAPEWYLTGLNSIMSNTKDKVTEDASGGHMVADDESNPSEWNLFFNNYAFYVQGGDKEIENGGKGKLFWSYTDLNSDDIAQSAEFTYLGGQSPTMNTTYPDGEDVFHSIIKNTYQDAQNTWVWAEDFMIFDDGDIAKVSDFGQEQEINIVPSSLVGILNFERVYTSSLFDGRKIDLILSAKLLKDAGMMK